MKNIKVAADILKGNLREARKYIEMAIEYKDECPSLYDWMRNMAKAHLDFNQDGHTLIKRMIADYKMNGKNSELAPGMMAMFNVIHADIMKDEMELTAMLQNMK